MSDRGVMRWRCRCELRPPSFLSFYSQYELFIHSAARVIIVTVSQCGLHTNTGTHTHKHTHTKASCTLNRENRNVLKPLQTCSHMIKTLIKNRQQLLPKSSHTLHKHYTPSMTKHPWTSQHQQAITLCAHFIHINP